MSAPIYATFKASKQAPRHLNLEVNIGEIVDHLDSKNLIPFKKRRNGYHLPGLAKEAEEQVIDEVDPELRPEEQGFVRHFLSYADILLKNNVEDEEVSEQQKPSEEKSKLTEMPKRDKAA